ncbi:MAG TPA: hypothetical protein VFI59_01980 [Actinomycetota bacterium]|nr:hypothetical protein [Actinomycetota bacterium]
MREVQVAGLLHLTFRQYQELETVELRIGFDLYERIVDLCGWPRGRVDGCSRSPSTSRR